MIDLNNKELSTVKNILKEIIPELEVIAFGSRVRDNATEFSDLDLAIKSKEPLTLSILQSLNEAFENSELNFIVDIVDYNNISDILEVLLMKIMK
ncbi:hypothetical protein C0585_07675 [Candidatus Woesearchaeota archaeon]|nr:MAG: hypothetical protein C0585_07675 [Candidatus Woesearchaeota archaeon]